MANFFSLQDGNLTDSSIYGYSLTGAEMMSNTTGTMLLTSSLYSTNFVNTNAETISALAVHLSARTANPSGTLNLTLQRTSSSAILRETINETYNISNFTGYDGSDNLLTNYSQNWQILKLTNPLTANAGDYINYSLKTSDPNQLSLMGASTAVNATGISKINTAGTPSLTSFKPYSNFDDSWYLNGTTDWFVIPANINFALTGNFTIETWINTSIFSQDTANRRIFGFGPNAANNLQLIFSNDSGTASTSASVFANATGTTNTILGTIPVANAQWHHIAVSRYNNSLSLYVDGVRSGPTVNNTTNFGAGSAYPLYIGSYNNNTTGGRFNGYINQFRIVNGTAVYTTSAFTPPSAASLEYIPNTVFLMKNGVNYDQALISNTNTQLTGTLTLNGTQLSSASPFGVGVDGSISFNGTTDYLTVNSNKLPTTGPFTFEAWIYPTDLAAVKIVFAQYVSTDAGRFHIGLDSTGIGVGIGSTSITGTTPISTNVWTHIAVTKTISSNYRLFVNGVLLNTVNNTQALYTGANVIIGQQPQPTGGTLFFKGCITNLRTLNTCIYLSNFTPSRQPLKNSFGTITLINSNTYSLTSYAYNSGVLDNLHIGGSLKGLTNESRTIQSDNAFLNNLYIHNKGTLSFPSDLGKTLFVTGSNGVQITSDGTLNIGTSSEVVPLSTTHTLLLSNTQIDVHDGGNLNVYGYPKTISTNLINDVVSGSRIFTTTNVVSTSWLVGDTLTFKPNLTFRTGFDTLLLSSFTDSNTFTTTSSSVYTHTGSATYAQIPAVYNLSRNVNIRGIDSSNRGTIRALDSSKTSVTYTQLSNIGGSKLKNSIILSNNSNGSTVLCGNSFMNDLSSYPIIFGNDENTKKSSVYLNGSSNFTLAYNAAYANFGTSDFTIEGWFNTTINTWATDQFLLANTGNWSSNNVFTVWIDVNRFLHTRIGGEPPAQTTTCDITHQIPISSNTWYHFAVVRQNGYVQLYLNGVPSNTSAILKTDSLTNSNTTYIGVNPSVTNLLVLRYFTGFFSNWRILNGTAAYTSSFDPYAIFPASNTANTKLLLFQDSSNTDKSVSNATLTLVGTPVYTRINPYGLIKNTIINNNIIYKPSNKSGLCLDFNKNISNTFINNNYILSSGGIGIQLSNSTGSISMSNNTTIGSQGYGTYLANNALTGTYGANNFNSTVQGMYVAGTNTGTIIGGGLNSAKEGVYVDASTSNLSGVTFKDIVTNQNSSVGFKVSGNISDYLNPVILNINGLSSNANSDFGFEGYNITGNLCSINVNDVPISSNLRSAIKMSIGNGSTIIDGLTSISSLYNFTSASAVYYTTGTQTVTTCSVTNLPAVYFNYNNNYITLSADIPTFGNTPPIGAGDFTIEFWVYYIAGGYIFGHGTNDGGFSWWTSANGMSVYESYGVRPTAYFLNNATMPANKWNHVACVRKNGYITSYLNGVGGTSIYKNQESTCNTTIVIGKNPSQPNNTEGATGYISNIRVLRKALYTSNFTPPTSGFVYENDTVLLLNKFNGKYVYSSVSNLDFSALNILNGYNYNQTVIKNALLYSNFVDPALTASWGLNITNVNKFEEFRLENSILSATIPLSITTSRPKIEGSYMFHNCNSDIYNLSSIAINSYQTDVYTETGLSVMSENNLSANHYKYLYAGKLSFDNNLGYLNNKVSEKLEPFSSEVKLKSSVKRISINQGESLSISVYIYKSLTPSLYSGAAPRLILRSNSSLGYYSDTILATSVASNGTWEKLSGNIGGALIDGVVEVYVDCSGNIGSGTINIDNWNY